jgi:hypothetical protein
MAEPSQTEHTHRSHAHSRKKFSGSNIRSGYFEPVFYFSGAILVLVFARLIHASLLSPILGALGIIILAVAKTRKNKPGVIISMIFILAMAMTFVWHWVDRYAVAVLSAEVSANTTIFVNGVAESLILTIMVWVYYRILRTIHKRMGQTWIVKRSHVKFLKMLFYFVLFLFLFWVFDFIILQAQSITRLKTQDSALIAGALALLASGIPAILYLSKGTHDEQKRHQHRHQHRHGSSSHQKNPDAGEK